MFKVEDSEAAVWGLEKLHFNKFWQNADGAGLWTRAAETAGGMAQRTHLEKHLMCQKYLFRHLHLYSKTFNFI